MSKKPLFPTYLPQPSLNRTEIGIPPTPFLPSAREIDAGVDQKQDVRQEGEPTEDQKKQQQSRQKKLQQWFAAAMSDHLVIIQDDVKNGPAGAGRERKAKLSHKMMSSNAGYELGSSTTKVFAGLRLYQVAQELYGRNDPMRKAGRMQQLATSYQTILAKHPTVAVLGLQEIDPIALQPLLSSWPGGQWTLMEPLPQPSDIKKLDNLDIVHPADFTPVIEMGTQEVLIYKKPHASRTGFSLSAWVDELRNPPPPDYHYYFNLDNTSYEGIITDAILIAHLQDGTAYDAKPDGIKKKKAIIKHVMAQHFGAHHVKTPIIYDQRKYALQKNLSWRVGDSLHQHRQAMVGPISDHHFEVAVLTDKQTRRDIAFANVHLGYRSDIAQNEAFILQLVITIRARFPGIEVNVMGHFNMPGAKMHSDRSYNITHLAYLRSSGMQRENRCDFMLNFAAQAQPPRPAEYHDEDAPPPPPPIATVLPTHTYDSTGERCGDEQSTLISPDLHLGDTHYYAEPRYFQPASFSFDLNVHGLVPRAFENALQQLFAPMVRVRRSEDQYGETEFRLCLFNLPEPAKKWLNRPAGIMRETTIDGRDYEVRDEFRTRYTTNGFYHFNPRDPSHRHELLRLFFEGVGPTKSIMEICTEAYEPLLQLLALEIADVAAARPVAPLTATQIVAILHKPLLSRQEQAGERKQQLAEQAQENANIKMINHFLRQQFAGPLLSYYAYILVQQIINAHPPSQASRQTHISQDIMQLCVGCSRDVIDVFYKAGCAFFSGKAGEDFRNLHYEHLRKVSIVDNPLIPSIEEEGGDVQIADNKEKAAAKPATIAPTEIDFELLELIESYTAIAHNQLLFQPGGSNAPAKAAETAAYALAARNAQQYLLEQFRHSRALHGLAEQAAQGVSFPQEQKNLAKSKLPRDFEKSSKFAQSLEHKLNFLGNQWVNHNMQGVKAELDRCHQHLITAFTEIMKYIKDDELEHYSAILKDLTAKAEVKARAGDFEKEPHPAHYQRHATLIQQQLIKLLGLSDEALAFPLQKKPTLNETDYIAFTALDIRLTYFCQLYLLKHRELEFWSGQYDTIASSFSEPYRDKYRFTIELHAITAGVTGLPFIHRIRTLIGMAKTYQEVDSIRQLIVNRVLASAQFQVDNPPGFADGGVVLSPQQEKDYVELQRLCNIRLRQLHYTRVASTEPFVSPGSGWFASDPERLAEQQDGLGRAFSTLPGGRPPTSKPYSSLYQPRIEQQVVSKLEKRSEMKSFATLCKEIKTYQPFLGFGAEQWTVVKAVVAQFETSPGNYDIHKPLTGPLEILVQSFEPVMNQCSIEVKAAARAPHQNGVGRPGAGEVALPIARRVSDGTGRYEKLVALRAAYMTALDISEDDVHAYKQQQPAAAVAARVAEL